MNDAAAKLSELLHEAGETHHRVFRREDGADDDWASWYSEWLVTHTELPELLATTPVRSALTAALVRLDKEYADASPSQSWEEYYAADLLQLFST
jgi:hypothetical protein